MAPEKRNEWDLPHLRDAYQLWPVESQEAWSVKFYPHTAPGVDPVFAVVGSKYVFVCRPSGGPNDTIEVIKVITDEEEAPERLSNGRTVPSKTDAYHCAWTKSPGGRPLLCVGGTSAKIKIYDIVTGELVRELTGHGADINAVETCPTNSQILASASDDYTVRVWSLDPAHKHQPCAAILAGGGHKDKILTLAWHESGRYLLSAGVDHTINLWTLPELPDDNTGTDHPTRIYYPNFSSSEIHGDVVDCITFYHDLIISKAANEPIVVWAILGFSSSHPIPPKASEPTTHDVQKFTRSSFTPSNSTPIPATADAFSPTLPTHTQFTRLFQLQNPDGYIMFTRFSLFIPAEEQGHAVIAMCTHNSKVMFWSLARIEEYAAYTASLSLDAQTPRPSFLVPHRSRPRQTKSKSKSNLNLLFRGTAETREGSVTGSSTMSVAGETETSEKDKENEKDEQKSKELWDEKYHVGDYLFELKAHREEVVRGLEFVGRQCAWSTGGEWCVVVGSASVVAVFQRWN
ncbi:WD domain-containing protein [Phlyctema vagabunda]|uniref:WD domain-containing protein n=1 Tax=Phlyctema vagabunda TaxID=108571 RepID=A0ABR4PYH8_9HELO